MLREFGKPPVVNGESPGQKEALRKLGYELFRLRTEKPSLRQLIRKFIRIGEQQVSNTLWFLHSSASFEDYEPVWLFLFGFDDQELLGKRRDFQRKLKAVDGQLAGFKGVSKNSLRQMVAVIDRDLAQKQRQLGQFEVGPAVRSELSTLSGVREEITSLGLSMSRLQLRIQNSERTVRALKEASTNIDTARLEELYRAAKSELPQLARKFSELQSFHNAMVESKVRFVQQGIERARAQLEEREAALSAAAGRESALLKVISDKGVLADLNKIHMEVNRLHESRGEKMGLLSRIEELEKELEDTRKVLDEAEAAIAASQHAVDKRLEIFNAAFSDYSRRLYGEEYVVYYDAREVKGRKRYEFKISNVAGNEGTGKKRAQIAAFDLAYMKLQSDLRSDTVRFTLHDQVETVSVNQLQTLFELAESVEGQFLVCVLADKLASVDDALVKRAAVLRLSQEDKFFRLP
ncbi:DUF2326 domain-containing protein [Myxococcus sp. RHSTA-1-4]|uniref:DUF2326 domain-containing protein n=1 Tax=Myxococcus sp. RHSTA-1-4 TaxID=2874601 RepID=UPI001CC0EA5F|nr:DUF2326 domain-containing protein [Myxococcus sp. RHSTA-1-4]